MAFAAFAVCCDHKVPDAPHGAELPHQDARLLGEWRWLDVLEKRGGTLTVTPEGESGYWIGVQEDESPYSILPSHHTYALHAIGVDVDGSPYVAVTKADFDASPGLLWVMTYVVWPDGNVATRYFEARSTGIIDATTLTAFVRENLHAVNGLASEVTIWFRPNK